MPKSCPTKYRSALRALIKQDAQRVQILKDRRKYKRMATVRKSLAKWERTLAACEKGRVPRQPVDCYGVYASYGKGLDSKKDAQITKAAWLTARTRCDSGAWIGGKRFARDFQCDMPPVSAGKADGLVNKLRKIKGVRAKAKKLQGSFCLAYDK